MSSSASGVPLESQPFPSAQLRQSYDIPDDESLESDTAPTTLKGEKLELSERALEEVSDEERLPRPNDFKGPKSTWREWTAEERQIATSLDQLQARNLGVHLYNTHNLRLRARALRAKAEASENAEADVNAWEPRLLWAAWPLERALVPREGKEGWKNEPKDEAVSRSSAKDLSSRQMLEELVINTASRIARSRFQARAWEGSESGDSQRDNELDAMEEDPVEEPPIPSSHRRSDSSDDSMSASSRPVTRESHTRSQSVSRATSRASPQAASRSQSSSPSASDQEVPVLEPVPTADDAQITLLLRRPARHILSQLDSLFAGLHHSRQSYSRRNPGPTSSGGTEDDLDQAEDDEHQDPAPRPTSQSRSRSSRRRKRRNSDSSSGSNYSSELSTENSDVASSSEPGSTSRSISRHRSRTGSRSSQSSRRTNYLLRDWSDVLGMAAVTGWDMAVVRRAQLRCEKLFREKMDFMDADSLLPSVAGTTKASKLIASEDEIEDGVHVDGFTRPVKARRGWRGKDSQKRVGKGTKKSWQKPQSGKKLEDEEQRKVGRPRKDNGKHNLY
ncbi:MAG: hypothetical protein MMC23_003682 [Stictis urceolatum]|nr:hypothetical protein [Stictis urceolata]